jgi:hypothetical protein
MHAAAAAMLPLPLCRWVAGLAVMVLFAAITWFTSALLADCYIFKGKRQRSYTDAVHATMGHRHATIIAWVQYLNLFLTAVACEQAAGGLCGCCVWCTPPLLDGSCCWRPLVRLVWHVPLCLRASASLLTRCLNGHHLPPVSPALLLQTTSPGRHRCSRWRAQTT